MKKEGTKQVLSLDQETAIRLYKTAAPELKELLEANFGLKVLSPKIEDRILTFDDVIDELADINSELVDQLVVLIDNDFPAHIIASHQITMIAKVFNEGTFMDTLDTNQKKWYPWFKIESSDLQFSSSDCGYNLSDVPAHLCFKNEALSDLAAERFVKIYKNLLS